MIILYELEGIGMPEIARLLGVSAITVRWHLSRGRKELAQIVTRQESQGAGSKDPASAFAPRSKEESRS